MSVTIEFDTPRHLNKAFERRHRLWEVKSLRLIHLTSGCRWFGVAQLMVYPGAGHDQTRLPDVVVARESGVTIEECCQNLTADAVEALEKFRAANGRAYVD